MTKLYLRYIIYVIRSPRWRPSQSEVLTDKMEFKIMKYFTDIKTLDALKKAFKTLIMKHHPDRGGDTEICQAINAEYDVMTKKLIDGADESDYTPNDKGYSFWESRAEHSEVEKKVKEAIQAIIMLDGLEIEIVGVWVWVGGDTKPHKEALKAAGFRWFCKKKKWAFAGKKSSGRGTKTMDEVRERYGSTVVSKTNSSRKAVTARRRAIAAV